MEVIDISVPLGPSTPVWPGSDPVRLWRVRDFDAGDAHAVSQMELGAHSGTHLDAPHHFLREGTTIDGIALDLLIGPCTLLDVSTAAIVDGGGTAASKACITADVLERAGFGGDPADQTEARRRVLIRTRHRGFWDETLPFDESFPGLDVSAAGLLIEAGVRLVGLDVPSVEPFDSPGNPVHHRLMKAGVVLLETLRLSHVSAGRYELICLPLAVTGAEASPARAVLRRLSD